MVLCTLLLCVTSATVVLDISLNYLNPDLTNHIHSETSAADYKVHADELSVMIRVLWAWNGRGLPHPLFLSCTGDQGDLQSGPELCRDRDPIGDMRRSRYSHNRPTPPPSTTLITPPLCSCHAHFKREGGNSDPGSSQPPGRWRDHSEFRVHRNPQ